MFFFLLRVNKKKFKMFFSSANNSAVSQKEISYFGPGKKVFATLPMKMRQGNFYILVFSSKTSKNESHFSLFFLQNKESRVSLFFLQNMGNKVSVGGLR